MMENVRAESRDRARSTQIGIARELRPKPGAAVPELTMDGGPRIRAGPGDPGFSRPAPSGVLQPAARRPRRAGHSAAELQLSGLAAKDARDRQIMMAGFVLLGRVIAQPFLSFW